jgi:hypothetical protein
MYIEQALKYKHEGWRYLVGAIGAFLASQLGSIPLAIMVALKIIATGGDISQLNDPNKLLTILDSNLTLFLMLLSFAFGLLGLFLIVKYLHNQSILSLTTSRKKIDWRRFWFSFSLIGIFTILMTVIDYFSNPEHYVLQFQPAKFLILAVIAIVMVPLQTSFEEYLFRGYLMQGLGILSKTRWVPLIITSVVFGGLHYFNPEVEKMGPIIMIYYIGTGFFLGIITLMDEGLELALGFHAANNLVGALLVTSDWTVFKTYSILKDISEPQAGLDVIAPVFIIYPVLIGIMAWRYNWNNWREKLFGNISSVSL